MPLRLPGTAIDLLLLGAAAAIPLSTQFSEVKKVRCPVVGLCHSIFS